MHISLYRKYRPETFADVVGQNHIERTLRNAVAEGKVAHAYLFTGPRGTGKTTSARLLAKALLCEKGPTGEPDATCEQCVEIAEGRHPDVHELDAASRTGVENVREEIIGRVQFAPTRGRYKLYIIDEVHMLSTSAFNALLKTLEEPPPHVVFVLATTHPHKVPETIHSRCQRFDFHRIGVDDIVSRLRYISDSEGFEISDAALSLIARHASGGMRDAITTLEQLAAFTGGKIGIDEVEGLIGEVDSALLFEVASLVARRDIAECFRWVARFVETGTDLSEFVRAFTGHVRDLYVMSAVGDATGIVERTAEELSKLESQAAAFGPDRLTRILDLLGEVGAEMRWSSDPRLTLEVALVRMARPQGEMTLEALAERVEELERGGIVAPAYAAGAPAVPAGGASASCGLQETPKSHAAASAAAAAEAAPSSVSTAASEPEGARAMTSAPVSAAPSVAPPAAAGGTLDRAAAKRGWQAVLVEIRKLKPARVQTYANVEVDVDSDGKTLVIEFEADQQFSMQLAEEPDMREVLKKALAAAFGTAPPFRFQLGRGAVRPQPAAEPQWDTAPQYKPEREPTVQPAATAAPSAAPSHEEPPYDDQYDVPPYEEETGSQWESQPAPRQEPAARVDSAHKDSKPVASAASPAPPSQAAAADDELTNLLVHGLGARIVAEHAHEPETDPEGEDQ